MLGGVGHLERRGKLFQKCPVTPAKEAVLFSLEGDAGWSCISTACHIHNAAGLTYSCPVFHTWV